MNCAELASHHDELVENRLAPALRAAAEEHVRTCAACRREVAGLRRVLAEAASLPESVEPLEDLWPSIEARLAPRPALRAKRFDWRTLAVAATLAAALVTAGIALRPRVAAPGGERATTGGSTPATAIPAAASTSTLPFDAAEQALLETKQRLREALAERRSTLSPATAAVVDRNLEMIENAIEEIRVALERDPANPQLNRRLLAIHQQELAFLQHVTQHGRPLQSGEEGPG